MHAFASVSTHLLLLHDLGLAQALELIYQACEDAWGVNECDTRGT
jgi:hypothetical protein